MTLVASRAKASAVIGKISGGVPVPVEQGVHLAIQLRSPVEGKMEKYVEVNRQHDDVRTVQPNTHREKHLALCGAGPSLRDADIRGADDVFACNSALPYLMANGAKVTAAIGIDQTPGLLREWADPPDVPYLVASSCDPELIRHLRSYKRSVTFFHNAVGFPNELETYCNTWPPTFMVGQGHTVVSRFIGVADWMGFERIDVYGADCSLGDDDLAHANGDAAKDAYVNPLIQTGVINGRRWRTRPDMLMDAVHLVRRVRSMNGRLRLMGDTLPVALLGKDDAFLDLVCRPILPADLNPSPENDHG